MAPGQAPTRVSLSICICTSGRPVELARCLESVAAGTRRPNSTIVSDDSRDETTTRLSREVCERFDFVHYVEGPRRGMCANRNHVIRQADTTHVSLIDDDGVVGHDFVDRAMAVIETMPDTIITGNVAEGGTSLSPPTNLTFLGHFGKPVRPGEKLRTIHLNCNVIPRAAFEIATFDESLVYGYEDADLCASLLARGFEIAHAPQLVNEHRPPSNAMATSEREWQAERARFSTTIRRYARWEPQPIRLIAFILVAPLHLFLHGARRRRWEFAACGWVWVVQDLLAGM